jgi:hypothetical protein
MSPPPTLPNTPPQSNFFRRFLRNLSYYSPAPHRVVFTSAFFWHSLAVRYFIMTPFSTLRAVTHVRPITFISAEIVQYLGGLNIGYALLAIQGLFLPASDVDGRKRNALVLAAASLSQVWFTVKFWRNARWALAGMIPIFIGDAMISLLALVYYFQQEHRPNRE